MCQISIQFSPRGFGEQIHALLTSANASMEGQRDGWGAVTFQGQTQTSIQRFEEPKHFLNQVWPSGWFGSETTGGSEKVGTPAATDTIFLAHGRTGTHGDGLGSVHPHVVEKGITLIHNGVLHWSGKASRKPDHENDSRQLALWLTRFNDPVQALMADSRKKVWKGYAALGVHVGNRVVVAVDNRANLHAWIGTGPAAGQFGFGTTAILAALGRPGLVRPLYSRIIVLDSTNGQTLAAEYWGGFDAMAWNSECSRSMGYQGGQSSAIIGQTYFESEKGRRKKERAERTNAVQSETLSPEGFVKCTHGFVRVTRPALTATEPPKQIGNGTVTLKTPPVSGVDKEMFPDWPENDSKPDDSETGGAQ